jgi:hypothetical protein
MEEKKLKYEKDEACARFYLHVFNGKVHTLCSAATSESKTRTQHGTKRGNCNTQESESHTASRCAEVAELNPAGHFAAHLDTYTAVAKSCQQSTLTSHSLKRCRPVVEFFFSDI